MKGVQRAPGIERALAAQQSWLFGRVTCSTDSQGVSNEGASSDDAHWTREGRLPAAQRIEVYRQGYFARLIECLTDDYPAVAHALGASDFEAVCLEFVEVHPPKSASLNFYGAPFAAFCATRPARFAAWVSELARLEWAVVEVIHADAEAVLDAALLGAIPAADWERALLSPSPALRVLDTAYPVHRYYRAFLEGEDPSPPPFEPSSIAVCRRGDDVWRIGVAPQFAALLNHLVQGMPLAPALDSLSGNDPAQGSSGPAAADLHRVLREWVACGFFAAVSLGGEQRSATEV